MDCGHPRKPDCQDIFPETQSPVTERFWQSVDRRASARFGAMRCKGDASRKQRGTPAPLSGGGTRRTVRKQRGSRRADESVYCIPNGINVRDLVREKFHHIKHNSKDQNYRMGKPLKRRWEMDDPESFQQSRRCHGRVQVQAGGKPRAEGYPKYFNGVHADYDSKPA